MKFFLRLIWIIALSSFVVPPALAQNNIKESIVKIYTVSNKHNYQEPWQMKGLESSSGSGCIIRGNRILTNAHVVSDQTFIQVRKSGEAKKYVAQVEIVAHECDLALLRVEDDSFFNGTDPLELGSLANIGDTVAVYGFPKGGDKLSITEGVVSRVEHTHYAHSGAFLLTCQIDAAINAGNSGGPVIRNNKIVGIAFQGLNPKSTQNIGYMIPVPVISHFLKDREDGKYDGIPNLAISFQYMESPDLRAKFSLVKEQTGVLVVKIYPGSSARGILEPGDVILSIEGSNIENDGTVEFRNGERTSFAYVLQNKYINDTVELSILREGKIINVQITLTDLFYHDFLVPRAQYDVAPSYYIVGGFVFVPLTENYLRENGKDWDIYSESNLLNYRFYEEPRDDRRSVVILAKVLADKINLGYHDEENVIISSVNGRKISTINDLISAFEEHEGKYHAIVDEYGRTIILDKKKADENNRRILNKYSITYDRSENLRER